MGLYRDDFEKVLRHNAAGGGRLPSAGFAFGASFWGEGLPVVE